MKKILIITALLAALPLVASAQGFDGLNMGLGNLSKVSNAETRSISGENFTGGKGEGAKAHVELPATRNVNNFSRYARDLGDGWKVNPTLYINPGETLVLAEIEGPGAIQHMWMVPTGTWRFTILRIYWDDETEPSVECPIGDFFCMGWNEYAPVVSLPVCVNPGSALNCFWQMPFRKKCKITVENVNPKDMICFTYQINYTLTEVAEDEAYFHASWRRTRYNEDSLFTIVDGIKGQGQYVGTYLAWGVHNNGWWGEGEVKFYIDGDKKYPTICTTGLEDYFLGSYNFERDGQYIEFTTPFVGMPQVIRPDGTYNSQQRFGLYRWHVMDPIRFKKDLRVTVQDLGWRIDARYLAQHSDIAGTAFWYQLEPHAPLPPTPTWEILEVY